MVGNTPWTVTLGAAPAATADTDTIRGYARTLASTTGAHILLVMPGSKIPADVRTPQAKTKARNAAREAAREAGDPRWSKVEAPAGVHLATDEAGVLNRYIKAYRKTYGEDVAVNMAIDVGRSNIIVVDVDTEIERDAFLWTWSQRTGEDMMGVPPTVSSPGKQDAAGNWVHSGGGHYYFTIPDGVELPGNVGARTVTVPNPVNPDEIGGQFSVLWRDRYVLIPPSVRAEGAYTLTGTDHPAPEWLLDEIVSLGRRITERAEREGSGELAEDIDAWSDQVSWESILEPAGWTRANLTDRCGCEIWTAPGPHDSPKSATTHGPECDLGRYSPNAPMHVWTDNPGPEMTAWISEHGTKTVTKLQALAIYAHGGDVGAAVKAEGLSGLDALGMTAAGEVGPASSLVADEVSRPSMDDLDAPPREREKPAPTPEPTPEPEPAEDPTTPTAEPTPAPEGPVGLDAAGATIDIVTLEHGHPLPAGADEDDDDEDPLAPRYHLAPFDDWRDTPPPTFLVDGWVEDHALTALIGPPGVGKSAVALDMACSIATGIGWQGNATRTTRVLYIAGEGVHGAVQRVKAWEAEHERSVGQDLFLIGEAVLLGTHDATVWPWLADQVHELGIGLVIFDTLARMALGLEENSATDMGAAVRKFDVLRRDGGCGVMVVHHTTRGSTHGRGSTALLGALDSELLVEDDTDVEDPEDAGGAKPLLIRATKQKNTAEPTPMHVTLAARHDSIVVANAYGEVVDPMLGAVAVPPVRPQGETTEQVAVRLWEYLGAFDFAGATRTDMVRDVTPSRIHRHDRDGWKGAVAKALDFGLDRGLIASTSDDPTKGSRFRRGSVRPEHLHPVRESDPTDEGEDE